MILIPVKNLSNAKQRLAAVLEQPSRTELAQAMLADVAETLALWKRVPVSLVTNDAFALTIARQFGFGVIPDNLNRSETDAIATATRVCLDRGIQHALVIPGDIPLIESSELDQIFDSAPSQGSVLVPASDGRGTNAAWRSPVNLFPLRFGNDSFKPHLAAARATHKPCVVLSLPSFGLDIDNPSDLAELAATPGNRRSQRLARELGFGELPLAANQ